MTDTAGQTANRPVWVELSSTDAAASRTFYAQLFGWNVEVNQDPQYGGYAIARIDGHDVAGIGGTQAPNHPTVWGIYIGTDDVDGLVGAVESAGGSVVAPSFDVGDQGRMAVFRDPTGAVISAWQAVAMRDFVSDAPNTLGWSELNARGVEKALPFYERLFGWTAKQSAMGDAPPYTEFQLNGQSIAGAQEMSEIAPAEMPSYWLAYFLVADVDDAFGRALAAGANELVAPSDFPGGRFAIARDPQGGVFGLLAQPQQ